MSQSSFGAAGAGSSDDDCKFKKRPRSDGKAEDENPVAKRKARPPRTPLLKIGYPKAAIGSRELPTKSECKTDGEEVCVSSPTKKEQDSIVPGSVGDMRKKDLMNHAVGIGVETRRIGPDGKKNVYRSVHEVRRECEERAQSLTGPLQMGATPPQVVVFVTTSAEGNLRILPQG